MIPRPRVLVAEPKGFSPRALAVLRGVADVDVRELRAADLAEALDSYDVLWFRLAFRLDESLITPARRCRILATPVTGLDHLDLRACAQAGIRVISLKGEVEFLRNVRATAELTVALTLALLRRIPQAHASVLTGEWNRDAFRGRELLGKTAGIVGVGRLGSIVAGYFHAFGMRVLGVDVRPVEAEHVEMMSSLGELLAESDVVSLHVPYEAATRNLVGAPELALLKPGAILVNTSRGGVLDETALLESLRRGRLSGAALDVLSGEPAIDGDHPVVRYAREHDNVLVVPHLGGNTYESFEKTEVFLAEKVAAALRDLPSGR